METISLKSLAIKVLERNCIGNQKETIPGVDGNSQDKREDARKPENGINLDKLNPLSLEEFKSKNLAIRIKSRVLGEAVWLVSNKDTRDHLKTEGLVCYLPEEIMKLKGLSPEALRNNHEVKKVFERANIVEVSDK